MVLRLVGVIILAFSWSISYHALGQIAHQQRMNQHSVAVEALVQSANLKRVPREKHVDYAPAANYTYSFEGVSYSGTQVLASDYADDKAWAQQELSQIANYGAQEGPEGGFPSTAYVDPAHPADAILVRDYIFNHYISGMIGLPGVVLGVCLIIGLIGPQRTGMHAVVLDESGWALLLPRIENRKKVRNGLIYLAAYGVAILAMPMHWLLAARQVNVATYGSWGVALAFTAGLGVMAYRRWSVCRHLSDARLRMRPLPFCRGRPLEVAVEMDAYVDLRVSRIGLRFVCTEHFRERQGSKHVTGTRTHVERSLDLVGVEIVVAGKQVDGGGDITLQPDLPATSADTTTYPYYTWNIHLTVELERMVDYTAIFPVEVR